MIDWLIDWLIYWLIDWSIGWLIDWLIGGWVCCAIRGRFFIMFRFPQLCILHFVCRGDHTSELALWMLPASLAGWVAWAILTRGTHATCTSTRERCFVCLVWHCFFCCWSYLGCSPGPIGESVAWRAVPRLLQATHEVWVERVFRA